MWVFPDHASRSDRFASGAIVLCIMAVPVLGAASPIYRCTGENGVVSFTDAPCDGTPGRQIGETQTQPAPPPQRVPSLPAASPPAPRNTQPSASQNSQSDRQRDVYLLTCVEEKFNAWVALQHPLPPWEPVRREKYLDVTNECRRQIGLVQKTPNELFRGAPRSDPVARQVIADETFAKLVRGGSIEQLKSYLATAGVTVNDRSDLDKALLDHAAEQNRSDLVTFLLEHGASADAVPHSGLEAGLSALHRAASVDAAESAEALISHGATVNIHGPRGATPLIFAAAKGNRKTVQVLLKYGADISTMASAPGGGSITAASEAASHGHADLAQTIMGSLSTPTAGDLAAAASRGDVEAVRLMLMHDDVTHDIPRSTKDGALRIAVINGGPRQADYEKIIELLLAHGADVNNRTDKAPNTPLMVAINPETAVLLLNHGADARAQALYGTTALESFSCNQLVKDPVTMVKALLTHGVDIKHIPERGLTALRCAIRGHKADLAEFLLASGFPVDTRDERGATALFDAQDQQSIDVLLKHGADINALDRDGRTPLAAAMHDGRHAVATMLMARKADAAAPKLAQQPMHIAAQSGQIDVLTMLQRANGAPVDPTDAAGRTPLLAAVEADQEETARYLMEHGADVNASDQNKTTPLHAAASRNNASLVAMLLQHHANARALNGQGFVPGRLATSADVRALLFGPSPADPTIARKACEDVARGADLTPASDEAQRAQAARIDPNEDSDYFDQVVTRHQTLMLEGESFVVGMADAPVYVARMGPDGVLDVLCEFQAPEMGRSSLRLMSDYERLQARSEREAISTSREALKVPGLWGAKALLDATRRQTKPVPLSSTSDDNVLGDAILADRSDVLRFYLESGVSPNLKWADHHLADGVHTAPWHDDPLYIAVAHGSAEFWNPLLEHGANPNAGGDYRHQPALALAVRAGKLDAVRALLNHGADPDLPPSTYVVSETISDIFRDSPQADMQVAAIHELLRHGGNPNAWISNASLSLARAKNAVQPAVAMNQTLTAEALEKLISTPGPRYPRIDAILREAMAFHSSRFCMQDASGDELEFCLPNALRQADADLTAHYATVTAPGDAGQSARGDERLWINRRDQKCGLRAVDQINKAGWFSYVLGDSSRAVCVLHETTERLGQLAKAGRPN